MDKIVYKTDLPPTIPDAQMRIKHTNQSIDYNLMHLYDHLGAVKKSLTKMATVDKPAASNAHSRVQSEIGEAFSKFDGKFHKSLKGVKQAPVSAGLKDFVIKNNKIKA